MRILLIANPNSTSQDDAVLRGVYQHLRRIPGARFRVLLTQYPGHAAEMVSGLRRHDVDAVVALGGDGTVNEIANGMLGDPTTAPDPAELPVLGVIPTGSANVFVRALGFPGEPVAAAQKLAEAMAAGSTRTLRLGTWVTSDRPHERHWFAVNAGFGLDADVLAAVDKQRARGHAATPLRYLAVTLRSWREALVDPPSIDADIELGTAANSTSRALRDVPLLLASNTNPWTFLGSLPVVTNPRNSFDQGLGIFGLESLHGPSGFAGLLHLFGAYRLSRRQVIQFDDARRVTLRVARPARFQADGESEGTHREVVLESIPNALEVFTP